MRCSVCFVVAVWVLVAVAAGRGDSPERLVVHEWGTFTELHDAEGNSIGGINTDDEPVPAFVHQISPHVLQSTNEPWRHLRQRRAKGLRWNAQARTRLETPVIYFYPPEGLDEPMVVDVDVQLRGGWLSEYYPDALAIAPGVKQNTLNRHAVGSLHWHGLQIGAEGEIPQTDEHVWTAPRQPDSARLRTPAGEAEDYLFYRGVGHFSGPLRVQTAASGDQLHLHSEFQTLGLNEEIVIPGAWLVHVRGDGTVAYRRLEALHCRPDEPHFIRAVSRHFEGEDFSKQQLDSLRAEMHQALIEDGLYADEATAMLATWRRAYFQSAGLRLFYLVPRAWTDDRMPLTLNVDADVNRVMMGRIELITDDQRASLAKLRSLPPTDREWMKRIPDSPARQQFFAGQNQVVTQLGVDVPETYLTYLNLGRFRNALIHHELQRTANANLMQFAATHGLLSKELQQQWVKRAAAAKRLSAN